MNQDKEARKQMKNRHHQIIVATDDGHNNSQPGDQTATFEPNTAIEM